MKKTLALASVLALVLTSVPAGATYKQYVPKPPKPPAPTASHSGGANPWPAFLIIGWGSCIVLRAMYANHQYNRELTKDEVAQCIFPLGYALRPLMGN